MTKKENFTLDDFRETLKKLFAFIPYFEERVNGTFKFQEFDEKSGKLTDFEGYEEYNKTAKFEDPVFDDCWNSFRSIVCSELLDKVGRFQELSEDRFLKLLRQLCYDAIHERMCTGYTIQCMAKGIYLKELNELQQMLMQNS